MGKNLRPEHLGFFHARMREHDKVVSVTPIPSADDFLFRIVRPRPLPDVVVLLSDVYNFGELDYVSLPDSFGRGDFILIAVPHAHDPETSLIAMAASDGVGIGKIGKFMGALNRPEVWEYGTPDERLRREREEKLRR